MRIRKVVRACEGVVSVFLALILAPLLSVTTIIVESSRIQNAQTALNQLMELAGMSTLASYDTKLLSRFGLLSVTQKSDVEDIFTEYLQENAQQDPLMELKDVTVSGTMPLSDGNILMRQISEYEKLRMPTEWLFDFAGMGIDALFDKLGNFGELVKNGLSATESLTGAAKAAKELAEAAEAFETAYTALSEAYNELGVDYSFYINAVNALSQFYRDNDPPPAVSYSTPPDPKTAYEVYIEDLADLKADVDSAQSTYSAALYQFSQPSNSLIDKFISAYNSLNSKKEALVKALGDLADNGEKAGNSFSDWQNEPVYDSMGLPYESDASIGKSDFTTGSDAMENMANAAIDLLDKFDEATLRAKKTEFAAAKTAVDALGEDDITKDTSTIQSDTDTTYQVIWDDLTAAQDDLDAFMKLLNEEEDSSDFFAVMKVIMEGLKAVVDLTAVYDPELSYTLDMGSLNMPHPGGANLSANTLAAGWNMMTSAWDDFEAADGGVMKFLTFLKAIGSLLAGALAFIGALLLLVAERVASLVTLGITIGSGNFLNNMFLSYYAKNTMQNRVSRSSTAYLPAPISTAAVVTGNPLTDEYPAEGTGNGVNIAFASCEQEYILYQSSSEILNQTLAFFDIFIMRIMTNVVTVFTADGVMSLINAIPFPGVAPVIKIILVVLEAFIDTLFIVNGQKIGFIKKDMFFNISASSPLAIQGIGDVNITSDDTLIGKLRALAESRASSRFLYLPGFDPITSSMEELSARQAQEEMEKRQKKEKESASGEPFDITSALRSLLSFDTKYDFYMMLFMLMMDHSTLLGRISNVIYMEMNYCYMKSEGIAYNLENAFTQIDAHTTASLNPIFVLPDMFKEFTATQTMGY